ncbi:MAG: CRTAC1 family protein [Myxococcota bacterium]
MRPWMAWCAALIGCAPTTEDGDSTWFTPQPAESTPPDTGMKPKPKPKPTAVLVQDVTPVSTPHGWITAQVLEAVASASIGDQALRGVSSGTFYGMWRLPEDLSTGVHDVIFRNAQGAVHIVPVTIQEPWFKNLTKDAGIGSTHDVSGWAAQCAESLTSVGVADIDLDGDMDLLHGNLMGPSRLYRNNTLPGATQPSFAPWNALESVDLVTAVSFADWDNDGDPDLFVGRRGHNRLYRNEIIPTGTVSFTNITATSGIAQADQRTTNAGFGDVDGDGLLDFYEVNHAWCFPGVSSDDSTQDYLYRNRGDGVFIDVSDWLPDEVGQVSSRYGFSAIWMDFDRTGTQDLWVVNDYVSRGGSSVLFRNGGRGIDGFPVLEDVTLDSGIAPQPDDLGKGVNAMGGDVGDINGDGWPDVVYSNIGPNFLMQSIGPGAWEDVSADRGIQRTTLPWNQPSVTWGSHLFDAENDGDLDIFFTGGVLTGPSSMPHAVFENLGTGVMREVSWSAGIASPMKGAASAIFDANRDGYLDWVVANWGAEPELWVNQNARSGNHWLMVELEGGEGINRDAFGSIVELVHTNDEVDTCWYNPRNSMAATGDHACHFGLGSETEVQRVEVRWPNGSVDVVFAPTIDRRMVMTFVP